MITNGKETTNPYLIDHHDGTREFGFGLTKREYFAAMALQGLCANSAVELDAHAGESAVELADKLIDALNKAQP